MRSVIVADAGPLIALAKIRQIELLNALFERVHIPAQVLDEAAGNIALAGAAEVKAFAARFAVLHEDRRDEFIERLNKEVDAGEAQAIALARELGCGVLMDDRIGRSVARRFDLSVIGVLGVLLQAKRSGHLAAVRPCLAALSEVRYHVAQPLVDEVLRIADE